MSLSRCCCSFFLYLLVIWRNNIQVVLVPKHAHASYPGLSFRPPGFSLYRGREERSGRKVGHLLNCRDITVIRFNSFPGPFVSKEANFLTFKVHFVFVEFDSSLPGSERFAIFASCSSSEASQYTNVTSAIPVNLFRSSSAESKCFWNTSCNTTSPKGSRVKRCLLNAWGVEYKHGGAGFI